MSHLIKNIRLLLDSDLDKVGITKSLSYKSTYPNYYTIDGSDIVDLGYYEPEDAVENDVENGEVEKSYGVMIFRGWNSSPEVKMLGSDSAEAHFQAIELVSNNKNEVTQVAVIESTGKTFAKKPLYCAESIYTHLANSANIVPSVKIKNNVSMLVLSRKPKIPLATINYTIETKSADELDKKIEKIVNEIKVFKSDFSKGLVYGIVYSPNVTDTHGDFTSKEEIEKAAHEFLPTALKNGTNGWTDVNHSEPVAENAVEVVESYIAPVDFVFESGEIVSKGSWVLVAKVNDAELKESIEKGEITGFSLEGTALKV